MWNDACETPLIFGNVVDVIIEDGSLLVDCAVVVDGVIWSGVHVHEDRLVVWREGASSSTAKPH